MESIEEFDPVAARILETLPKDLPQAQYSTSDQLLVLLEFARRLKLYDALALLSRILTNKGSSCS